MRVVGEITGEGYKLLVPRELIPAYKDIPIDYKPTDVIDSANVIAALNGPMAHVYVKGGTLWNVMPDDKTVAKLAKALKAVLQDGAVFLTKEQRQHFSRLVSSVDKILVRRDDGSGKKVYCVFEGLNADGTPKCVTTDPFNSPEYVKADERISEMNELNRSGDIVLLMKFNTGGEVEQRYTTGVSCKSWHGSLNRSDSYVPFIVAYPGGNKYEIENILTGITGCNKDTDIWKCDYNYRLPEIIMKVITTQYK